MVSWCASRRFLPIGFRRSCGAPRGCSKPRPARSIVGVCASVTDLSSVPDHEDSAMSAALVLVGTPIGHLGDLSERVLEVLRDADVLACEDTRRTRTLLTHAGI